MYERGLQCEHGKPRPDAPPVLLDVAAEDTRMEICQEICTIDVTDDEPLITDANVAAPVCTRTVVPNFVQDCLEQAVHLKELDNSKKPDMTSRRLRGKQQTGNFVKRVQKSKIQFPRQNLDDDARNVVQRELRSFVCNILTASSKLPDSHLALEAASELAVAGHLDEDALIFLLKQHLTNQDLVHAKLSASIVLARERGNDIYRLLNGQKRCVITVSNTTHGLANVGLAIRLLCVAFVVGFDAVALKSLKAEMQTMGLDHC